MSAYFQNLLKLTNNNRNLVPRVAAYYVTMQCNLNCAYFEDFGSRRNHQITQNNPLKDPRESHEVICGVK